MSTPPLTFRWNGEPVPFLIGETIAAALDRAGITRFDYGNSDMPGRYFCGIGACQCCVVSVDGRKMEACLTPAQFNADVRSLDQAAYHEM